MCQNNQNKNLYLNSSTISSRLTNSYGLSKSTGMFEYHHLTKDQDIGFFQVTIDKKTNKEEYISANMTDTCLFEAFNSTCKYKKWLVNSGASQHMIASESLIHDTVDVSKLNLLISHRNGTSAEIEKKIEI